MLSSRAVLLGAVLCCAVLHPAVWISTSTNCRRMPGGEMEAEVVTHDHKPNLEQQRGATRLAQEQV